MTAIAPTLLFVFYIFAISTVASAGGTITTSWGGPAKKVYDTGFMNKLMKHPDGGVSLFNMELIENDAPGSGRNSEKGVCSYSIWGVNHTRKILYLSDPRTTKT